MSSRFFVAFLLAALTMLGSASFASFAFAQQEDDASETPKETAAQKAIRLAEEAAEEARARAAAAAQEQIAATNAEIQRLKNEIAELQKNLTSTTAQKQTLQNAIKALDLQIQKLQKSVSLTTTQISQKDKEIGKISGTISDTEKDISDARKGVAESLRKLEQMDEEHFVTSLLGGGTLSSFFDEAVAFESLRGELQNRILHLNGLKGDLQDTKKTEEQKRQELAALKNNLNQQRQGAAAAKADQTTLLAQTKNKETEYQALIAKKQAEEAKFEQDLANFEAQLGLRVIAGSIPLAQAGVLRWPLDTVRITQFFGNTSFATQNPQIYGGKGHNAVDMAAPTGTPVKAAKGGVVLGTGNTDTTCPNASYGKWIFIKHENGLSTLYAHLSNISVSGGQSVEAGEVVGYSGNTGYSTGPHLHFSVYASTGSKIDSFPSTSCRGKTYTMPVGDSTAYLNPLSYLPAR
jgi:murein DD-endopeptidase MepM/ murein hydrolase activator NlpD